MSVDTNRRAAYLILKDIEDNKAWSNLSIKRVLAAEPNDNPAFIRELVYGILRNRTLLDYNISMYLKNDKLKSSERCFLRMGFYQLSFMNSVTDYAAVNETVNLAAGFIKGHQGFINAVLRSFARNGKKLLFPGESEGLIHFFSVKYSCNEDIIKLWLSSYGREKTEEMLKASLLAPEITVRINPLKKPHGEFCGKSPDSEGYRNGFFSIQGLASQKAVSFLAPVKGEHIIDLCAAPGGKCCAAAELMENEGDILAFDIYDKRVELIKREARRLGVSIIRAQKADASVFMPELEGTADAVICDVPCSGLGTLSKKPEIKLRSPGSLSELITLQAAILKNASLYVKPGGRILYSTCTVNPGENSLQTAGFIKGSRGYKIDKECQLFPDGEYDGFYICLIRRLNA